MSDVFPSPTQLDRLPTAIWMLDRGELLLCRGTPEAVVRGIAAKKGLRSSKDTITPLVRALAVELAQERGVHVDVASDVPDHKAAAVFLHGLLVMGLARAMASA